MTIETDRLLLRSIVESDATDIYEYSSETNVGPNAGWKPHESLGETIETMKSIFIDQEGVFGIILQSSGKLIGSIGLVADPKRENPNAAMLGYASSQRYWGAGYMTEAAKAVIEYGFETMGLEIISAYCYPDNIRSKHVLEKCGFKYEGCLRRCEVRYDGMVLNNECYSIVKNITKSRNGDLNDIG